MRKMTGIVVLSLVCAVAGFQIGAEEAEELEILRSGPNNAASYVLMTALKDYKESGKEALARYVPAASSRLMAFLQTTDTSGGGEAAGEQALRLIKMLALSEDPRAKSALLAAMASTKVGSGYVAKGLAALGKTAVPDVIDVLRAGSSAARWRAAKTLMEMEAHDPTLFDEPVRAEVRGLLVQNVDSDYPALKKVARRVLGTFGDSSTVPLLQRMAQEGDSEAARALQRLRDALK